MRRQLLLLASLVAVCSFTGSVSAQELPPPRVLPPRAVDPGLAPTPLLPPPRFLQPWPPPRLLPRAPFAPRTITMPGGATYLVRPDVMIAPPPYTYYRPSAYQVWQYYGVTYSGYFRPRVLNTGNSGFYLYRGLPFPWVNNYPGNQIMPFPMP